MIHNMFVLDSSVYCKIFLPEKEQNHAKCFLRNCLDNKSKILVPHIFLAEVLNVVSRYDNISITNIWKALVLLEDTILTYVNTTPEYIDCAQKILASGNHKEGFPSFYDSLYHAIAIVENALFITADHRHYRKTSHYGHIKLLEDVTI